MFVKGEDGAFARTVKLGLDNNRMVRVIEGLAAGEAVLLQPPLDSANGAEPDAEEIPDIEIPPAAPEANTGRPGPGSGPGGRPRGKGQRPAGGRKGGGSGSGAGDR